MGMWPSASIVYGIPLSDLDTEESRITEDELEEFGGFFEALLYVLDRGEVGSVTVDEIGTANGESFVVLNVAGAGVSGWGVEKVNSSSLAVTPESLGDLERAWTYLYPHLDMPEPGWYMGCDFS